MKQFILKHFYKNKIICVQLYHPDRRLTSHYVIPTGNTAQVGKLSFHLDTEHMYLSKGIPTFTYNSLDPASIPIQLEPADWKNSKISANAFNDAIDETITSKIITGFNTKISTEMMMMLLGGVMIAAIGVLWYMLSQDIQSLQNALNEQRPVIEALREKIITGGFE